MKFTHETVEKNIGWLIVLTILVVAVGGRAVDAPIPTTVRDSLVSAA